MKSGLRSVWSLLLPLGSLPLTGCGPDLPRSVVSGSVTFERTEIAAGTSTFADCTAGIRQQFNGADLAGNGFSMRVLRTDAKQPAVVFTQEPTQKTVELTAASCSVLDVYLVRGWGEIEKLAPGERFVHGEHLREYDYYTSGSALLDCKTPAGGRVRGSLSFRCGP